MFSPPLKDDAHASGLGQFRAESTPGAAVGECACEGRLGRDYVPGVNVEYFGEWTDKEHELVFRPQRVDYRFQLHVAVLGSKPFASDVLLQDRVRDVFLPAFAAGQIHSEKSILHQILASKSRV